MTGGPHLSATAREGDGAARAGAEERWAAGLLLGRGRATSEPGRGVRGPPADFSRRIARAGLGFKQRKIRGLF